MRQTSAEIDLCILDTAAAVFAKHGYGHTSVQQIADLVGYSKAGLLHRFTSKESLHRAVINEAASVANQVMTEAGALPDGGERRRRTIELIAEQVLDRTGIVQFIVAAFDPDNEDPGVEEIQSLGYRLVDLIDHPLEEPTERLRVVLALQLLVNAALAQDSEFDADMHVAKERFVPFVSTLALSVLTA